MQRWEYAIVTTTATNGTVRLVYSEEKLAKQDFFKSIDPTGKMRMVFGNPIEWKPGLPADEFLLRLLDKLGNSGWEMTAVVPVGMLARMYFKRVKRTELSRQAQE